MPTAADIARAAWTKEDTARRNREAAARRQREAAALRAQTRAENAARSRLAQSVIPHWFPGVEWIYVESEGDKDIWSNGENSWEKIQLAVLRNLKDGNGRLRAAFVQGKDGERGRGGFYSTRREVWKVVPVNTVAEVWSAKRHWDEACTLPPWA